MKIYDELVWRGLIKDVSSPEIEEKLNKEGFIIGCWDKSIEKLNYNNIKKVLDDIPFGSTDIQVSLNRKNTLSKFLM